MQGVVCFCIAVNDSTNRGWLQGYDVDACGGRGMVTLSPNRADAKVFTGAAAFITAYRSVPRAHPLRPDGRPNRPLTAFHVEVMRADLLEAPLMVEVGSG
jgi:hypothetical protein